MKPQRVVLKRVKGYRKPASARAVTRSTFFGNPFIGEGALYWFRYWIKRPRLSVLQVETVMERSAGRYDVPPGLVSLSYKTPRLKAGEYIRRAREELRGSPLA